MSKYEFWEVFAVFDVRYPINSSTCLRFKLQYWNSNLTLKREQKWLSFRRGKKEFFGICDFKQPIQFLIRPWFDPWNRNFIFEKGKRGCGLDLQNETGYQFSAHLFWKSRRNVEPKNWNSNVILEKGQKWSGFRSETKFHKERFFGVLTFRTSHHCAPDLRAALESRLDTYNLVFCT